LKSQVFGARKKYRSVAIFEFLWVLGEVSFKVGSPFTQSLALDPGDGYAS
jgi:hypothetical protein